MEFFEKDFYDIAKNIEFQEIKKKYGDFQGELKSDLGKLKKSKCVIIAADKSSNFYTCDVETYRKLQINNVQKEYKKATLEEVESVNKKFKEIAETLKLENRMQK